MDLVVVALFWALCGWIIIRRAVLLAFAAAIAMLPFGSMAAVPAELTGGLTLLPAPVLSLIGIMLFVASRPGRQFLAESAFSVRKLGLVSIFLLIAAFSALFYPRIFAGMAEVVPMRGDLAGYGGGWTRLAPSPQNLSQLFYLSISTMLIFCFAFLMQYARYQQIVLKAIFVSSIITVATGVLDYASQYTNLSFLLDPFRTATYSLLTEHDVLDSKRIVGLMPEASSFGPMCVGRAVILLLWRDAFESQRIRRYIALLVPLLFLFGFLSTSSSAYLAIGVAGAVLGLRALLQLFGRRRQQARTQGLFSWKLMAAGGVAVLVGFYALNPGAFSHVESLIDRMVVGKSSSSSFDERMAWNTVSLQALADTYGIGVGVGGTRASSWPVSVVTNLGIPGALVLLCFMLQALLRRKIYFSRTDMVLCRGGAWAVVPLMSSNALTGTSPDIGMMLALILGVQAACGLARQMPAVAQPGIAAAPVPWRRHANMGQL
jgi:hypothetical protein